MNEDDRTLKLNRNRPLENLIDVDLFNTKDKADAIVSILKDPEHLLETENKILSLLRQLC
jgi:hypothetical protein